MEKHDRILGYFLEEAIEHLNTIEQGLRKLPETVKQPTMIRELFRAAHSIKGSAAMLGLLNVQKIGNQFEANFKLLKEQPEIAVDDRLRSLFLESFGLLQASINEVRVSSDPYRQDPDTPDPIGDPVFEELKSYLQHLLATVNPSADSAPTNQDRDLSQDPALEQVFGEYVTRKLAEIISLCLQPDLPETRIQIQQICQKLGNLGENFEFLEWTNLFTACRLAIANPANRLAQLGEVISIAVKQAQVLILADRHQAIDITPDLEALINQHNRLDPVGVAELPVAEQNADAMELNEFMNLLSNDMPTEGTWMQDDDFFDLEMPLQDLGDSSNDKFYQQIFEPVSAKTPVNPIDDLAAAIDQKQPAGAGEYDEETFYSPDLGEIDDREIANFWSDAELAAPQHPSVYPDRDLDLPGSLDRQLHPDLAPALDLDSPAPDFGLDRPMSELFPTVATPSFSGLDQPQTILGEIVTSGGSIESAETISDINELTSNDLDRTASIELAATVAQPEHRDRSNDFQLDLPTLTTSSTANVENDLFGLELSGQINELIDSPLELIQSSAVESPGLNNDRDDDIADRSDSLNSGISDILCLEDLNSDRQFSEAAVVNFSTNAALDHQIADNLADLNLDIFNSNESIENLVIGDDLVCLDFDPLTDLALNGGSPSIISDLTDLNLNPLNPLDLSDDISSIPSDLIDLDLDTLNSLDLSGDLSASPGNLQNPVFDTLNSLDLSDDISSIPSDLIDLDLDTLNSLDLSGDLSAISGNLQNPVFDTLNSLDLSDEISSMPDLDLDTLNSLDLSDEAASVANNFMDLEIDPLNPPESIDEDPSITGDFTDLDLDTLNSLDLSDEDPSLIGNLADLDLDPLNALGLSSGNPSITSHIADLDLDPLNDLSLSDENPSISSNIADLDLDNVNALGLSDENPSISSNIADLDLDPVNALDLSDENQSLIGNIADLDLDLFNSDLDIINSPEAVVESSDENIFAGLEFDFLDRENPELAVESTTNSNFIDLELDSLLDLAPADENQEHTDFITESATNHEFADLNLDFLNADHLDIDPASSSNLDDFSALDFNLDNLSGDLINSDLTDLGSILDEQPASNLTDLGDLDALFTTVAVGAAGAAIIGGYSELDNLLNPPTTADPVDNLDSLDRLLETPAPVVIPAVQNTDSKPKDRRAKQSRTFEQTMRVSVRHLDNLNNLVGELVVNRNTLEQDQNRMRQFIEKLLSEVQKLNEVGKRMQDLYERSLMENSLVASRQQHKPISIKAEELDASGTLMEYDPLEMDRFTPIHLLSQKMIELTVRVRESTADIEFVVDGSTEVTRTLRQITGQLQEDLTKSRMLPFAQTADRLQRGVRDNGLKYGKQIELNVEGRDTLIDKVILESLAEPLMHMANNAIAHGIESAETRQAIGKPVEGKITIRALHQGNQTIISISDDGAGINTEQVKAKAIEKGIITIQQAATMSKSETYELLFLPSFSTKDQADELSGRGVGMDVVRTSLTEIRGTITTESQLGVGTTFTIRLPLALSIAKALIAVNNKSNIAFPMDGIEDTQDVSPEQIQTNSEGEQCIFWRDELMPFKPLSDLLGFNRPLARNNFYTTSEDDSDLVSILILRSDGNLIAVQVDKITGDQEIVIKPLQGPAAKPLGIAGATVMGDGRIIPIADVMELIALANGTITRHISTQWTDRMMVPTVEVRESMVLIVDDSITVRELLSLTFKRAGYRVEQARDGQEAWDKLRAGLPCDIVFCDIEMPRMDGLEFLSRVQKDTALSKVPVAMLTSRGSDRHRQIASQLGASGYFIKPYLEEALLDAAKRMIGGEVLEIV